MVSFFDVVAINETVILSLVLVIMSGSKSLKHLNDTYILTTPI